MLRLLVLLHLLFASLYAGSLERLQERNIVLTHLEESNAWKADEIERYIGGPVRGLSLASTPVGAVIDLREDLGSAKRTLIYHLLDNYDEEQGLSSSDEWKEISSWSSSLLGMFDVANNQDPRAYASSRGLQSPKEDFLSFGEYYFLPPETRVEASVKCRTPRKYAFFKKHFRGFVSPLEQDDIVCASMERGFLDDLEFYDPINAEKIELGPINMQSVKGFELLYATPGTADASEIAGHLLLRIKLDNNPEAEEEGFENPHDIVVSFLANTGRDEEKVINPFVQTECKKNWFDLVDDGHSDFDAFESVFQSLKGLSGGFLTMMDRQTLGQTIKHYTIEEDRNLLRYRLRLTDKQKKDLLKRLYLAKKNYNARYYFFPQNCASVLVKVISQGIGNEEIAHFDPFVSPPNTLVSLFIRNGLAVPVYPSFYSYRKKAYLAQDEIRVRYKELRSKKPELAWPDISPLFDDEESERLALLAPLRVLAEKNSELEEEFYLLANLIQEAEAAYGHKELICENYTSKVTAQARKLQESLLERMAEPSPFHTQRYLQKSHLKSEREAYEEGLPRTRLLSYGFGLGHYHSDSDDTGIMRVDATIEKQEMGSISSVAMQRGNSVSLGSLNLSLGKDSDGGVEVKSWGARALKIRKFQERLDYIPSYFSSAGSLGLGLTLLDFRGNKEQERLWGTLAGGEILFNLLSSRNNNDYAFVSLGADVVHQRNPIRNATGLALPIYTETLMSFGRKRETQWRNHFEYRPSVNDTLQDELILDTGLSRQMGHLGKQLVLLKMVLSYSKSIAKTQTGPGSSYMQTWVGLEMNPW